jgi:hypothetical protein
MKKKKYFNDNESYFNYVNKKKDDIKMEKVYMTKTKRICLVYKNRKKEAVE